MVEIVIYIPTLWSVTSGLFENLKQAAEKAGIGNFVSFSDDRYYVKSLAKNVMTFELSELKTKENITKHYELCELDIECSIMTGPQLLFRNDKLDRAMLDIKRIIDETKHLAQSITITQHALWSNASEKFNISEQRLLERYFELCENPSQSYLIESACTILELHDSNNTCWLIRCVAFKGNEYGLYSDRQTDIVKFIVDVFDPDKCRIEIGSFAVVSYCSLQYPYVFPFGELDVSVGGIDDRCLSNSLIIRIHNHFINERIEISANGILAHKKADYTPKRSQPLQNLEDKYTASQFWDRNSYMD